MTLTAVLRSGNAGYCDIDRGRNRNCYCDTDRGSNRYCYCDTDRGRNRNCYLGHSLTERAVTASVAARIILALLQTTYC
jgi:hypothetical protein